MTIRRLRISCPHCGVRAVEEFVHGEIPTIPEGIVEPEARDLDRAFMHTNAEGVVVERWFHAFGCRRWLTLARDTRTNDIPDNRG
ncbi:MAG: sarcosine oxidase subunit delta [Acidobacteria bacterium]|jgi:methylglutamate dehydrogenase subunit B|nr:sarcosine oxidase subunit delta [Acidobacteriota bacterium]